MNDEPAVLTERRGRIFLITINRPDQRNAVNAAVAEGIAAALEELDADAGLSLAILTGAGKGFSAGMDLKAFVTGERPWAGDRGFAGITQRSAEKPLIAAVEGFAVAGGLEIALACDLIVASRGTRLGIPEVTRSLVAAGGALLRLPRVLPRTIAMELALTGQPILAERAYELGLVNKLAEPGEAVATAFELARHDRRQRAAGAGRHQARPHRGGRLARLGVLRPSGGDCPTRDVLRRRSGRGQGVRREALAGLAGTLIGARDGHVLLISATASSRRSTSLRSLYRTMLARTAPPLS